MTEHEPSSPSQFDAEAIAKALRTRAATVRDVAFGEGWQFSTGHGAVRLEVYPRTEVTRVTTQDARVELFGSAVSSVSDSGVEFLRREPTQEASLAVVAGGGVVFTFVAGGIQEPAGEGQGTPDSLPSVSIDADRSTHGPETRQSGPGDRGKGSISIPPATRPPEPSTAAPAPSEGRAQRTQAPETEQERVRLTGRLGRDPQFRTTRSGTLVARFPLAVHLEDGRTDWHTILSFGDRAQNLQARRGAGALAKGNEVSVVGYVHTKEQPGKDGTPKLVREIYAVAVMKR